MGGWPAAATQVTGQVRGWATHYGGGPAWGDALDYNGGWLGCALYLNQAGDNRYYSEDTTVVAIGPGSPWACGDMLLVCGPLGCIQGIVQDACPGCGRYHVDLSEAGHEAICANGSCAVTIAGYGRLGPAVSMVSERFAASYSEVSHQTVEVDRPQLVEAIAITVTATPTRTSTPTPKVTASATVSQTATPTGTLTPTPTLTETPTPDPGVTHFDDGGSATEPGGLTVPPGAGIDPCAEPQPLKAWECD